MVQVGIQDVRNWGYTKIINHFYNDSVSRTEFLNMMERISCSNSNIKVSGFSFLGKWIPENNKKYRGMRYFVNAIEPMFGNLVIDNSIKSRFRNNWTSMWGSYQKAVNCTDSELCLLRDVALKLAIMEYDVKYLNAYRFFSSILIWYLFTRYELNCEKAGLTLIDVIAILISTTSEEFVDFVLNKLDGDLK